MKTKSKLKNHQEKKINNQFIWLDAPNAGAGPAAASCRSRFAVCPFELYILFRNMTVRHPAGMHSTHRRRKPKGLLWAAASCRSQLGNHWCSLFAPPPQAIKACFGLRQAAAPNLGNHWLHTPIPPSQAIKACFGLNFFRHGTFYHVFTYHI